MHTTELSTAEAEAYARRLFMLHARHGAGLIAFVTFIVMLCVLCFSAFHGLKIAHQPAQVESTTCYIIATLAGFCAIVMFVVWRRMSRKASCFSDDAVITDGNTTKQAIRGYLDNYAF